MFSCCFRNKQIQYSKVVCIEKYGPIKDTVKIRNIPLNDPSDIEVLIEIRATSLNPIDWKINEGHLKSQFPLKFPYILGRDFAGVIKKVGSEVKNFKKEDPVY